MNRRGPFQLDERSLDFPSPELADPSGLLAVGGDLEPERVLAAYRAGIFPWPLLGADGPMLWFSPDPRLVLYPERFRVSRSLRKELRQGRFEVTVDTRFREVMTACAEDRSGRPGTWITQPLIDAFDRLHPQGVRALGRVSRGRRAGRRPLRGRRRRRVLRRVDVHAPFERVQGRPGSPCRPFAELGLRLHRLPAGHRASPALRSRGGRANALPG